MQNPLKSLALTLPPEVFRDLKVRLVLLLVFAASAVLVVWSIMYRLPDSDRKLALLNTRITEIEKDIDDLQRRWNAQDAEQTAARFKQSQELLFAGQEEVGAWQAELKRQ